MATSPQNVRSLAASSALLLALAGCGGSGDDGVAQTPSPPPAPPAPVTLTGSVVVDQAIQNAVVCMDLNANNVCDTGEPVSAKTGASGAYSITYDPASITAAQATAASLIATMVPGAPTNPNTTIDAAEPGVALTEKAYVLKQVPGKSGQINPLTTLVAAGIQSGLAENTARTNAAAQLAITEAKIDNYQDDPATVPSALVDNARLMARVTGAALEEGATLEVSSLPATDASQGDLNRLEYTSADTYVSRSTYSLATAAASFISTFQDIRTGMASGTPTSTQALYPTAYLTTSGWARCTDTSIQNNTRGVPSRTTICGTAMSVGFPVVASIEGKTMASVVTAMQADAETNTIINGSPTSTLLADLGTATFPTGSTTRTRTNFNVNAPIFISNTNGTDAVTATVTTLDQLISARPASSVNLANGSGALTLGLSTSALRNLRVAFTGTPGDSSGTVQFYDCDLNTAGTAVSHCTAAETGTYSIRKVNGARVMEFAGHAATTASNQVNLYVEVENAPDVATGNRVFRARQTKMDIESLYSRSTRLNGVAWKEMKGKLGL